MFKKILILITVLFLQIHCAEENCFSIEFKCATSNKQLIKYDFEHYVYVEYFDKKANRTYQVPFLTFLDEATKKCIASDEIPKGLICLEGAKFFYVKFDTNFTTTSKTDEKTFKYICLYDEPESADCCYERLITKVKIELGKKHIIVLDLEDSKLQVKELIYS